MFTSIRQHKKKSGSEPMINIAPLIDVVFILLIFFLVTSTFIQDRGIEITRPAAVTGQPLEPFALRVGITEAGNIYIDSEPLQMGQLRDRVALYARTANQPKVVLLVDEKTVAGQLVEVLDTIKIAGVQDVAVATRERRDL